MWFVHTCLAFHGSCQPQSWTDLGELLVATFLAVVAIGAFFLGLLALGDRWG